MNKIKKVVKLAKSLGSSYPLQNNYTLIKVSSQLPPYTDLARGVSSLDHYEVRHPYSDDVIGALTVWSATRIPTIVKLGVFQDGHKSIGLIEAIHDKLKEMYSNIPEDLLSYMYTIWGGVTANTQFDEGLHPAAQLKFHEIFSALKRAPLRKSDSGKAFEDHLDYHVYQNDEHVGTVNGQKLNEMMPSQEHRDQVRTEKGLIFHPANMVSGSPASFMKKAANQPQPFHDHLDYHVYQNNEHVGTMGGKDLNAMLPSEDHRSKVEKEQGFVFHATNTVTGNPASYMKKSNEQQEGWMVKLAGSDDYHPLVDIIDNKKELGQGGGNVYSIKRPDGSITQHHQDEIEDLKHSKELAESMPVFMRD